MKKTSSLRDNLDDDCEYSSVQTSTEWELRPIKEDLLSSFLDQGPWTAMRKTVLFLAALSIIFDGFDNQLMGFAVPAIARDWSLPRGAFAPILALGLLGMVLGSALAGYFGDRWTSSGIDRMHHRLWALHAGDRLRPPFADAYQPSRVCRRRHRRRTAKCQHVDC